MPRATRFPGESTGSPLNPKGAGEGLDVPTRLFSATTREALVDRLRAEQEALRAGADAADAAPARAPAVGPSRSAVSRTGPVPTPPDLALHVLRDVPLTHVFPHLTLQMLLRQ